MGAQRGRANRVLYDLLEDEAKETDISTVHQSAIEELYQEVGLWGRSILDEARENGCLE